MLALVVGATFIAPIQSAAAQGQCNENIVVVAATSPEPVGDTSLIGTLAARSPGGGCLAVVDDDRVSVSIAEAADVVVIAGSVTPAALGDRLVDAAVPILVSQSFLFDDMAMISARRTGQQPARDSIFISDQGHSLAGGLSGLVKVYSGNGTINFGGAPTTDGFDEVGRLSVGSNRSTLFGFAAGSKLTDRTAAAGRVGFFAASGVVLSSDGKQLLNSAIDWLLTQPPGAGDSGGDSDDPEVLRTRATRRAILVAGRAAPILSADREIVARLVQAGFELQVVDDDSDFDAVDIDGVDFIAISTSVLPSKIATTFANLEVPIITWESQLFDDLGMATESGETRRLRTTVTIIDPGSPLAGGLGEANRAVYESPNRLAYGVVGGDALVVAHEVNRPDNAVVFAYDTGDELADGSIAVAPRIGLFASFAGGQVLTDQGLDLFDAAWSTLTGASVGLAAEADRGAGSSPLVLDVDGNPVIARIGRGTGVTIVHCDDAFCRGTEEANMVGPAADPSLALDADGNPVVFFHAFGVFHLVHCNDANCEGDDETDSIIDIKLTANPVASTSVAVGFDGNPVLAYSSDSGLKIVTCNDPDCADGDDTPVVFDADNRGLDVLVLLDTSNNPTLVYAADTTPPTMQIARCNDPACSGGDESIGTVAGNGSGSGFALDADGNPVVITTRDNNVWQVTHCNDPICSGGDDEAEVVATNTSVSPALAVDSNGNPVVAFWVDSDDDTPRLELVVCNDPNCADKDEFSTVIDRSVGSGPLFPPSITVGNDGLIVVAYGTGRATVGLVRGGLTIDQGHKLALVD